MTTNLSAQNLEQTDSAPWYRYPMVWMVIILPLIVVAASFYTIVIAHQNAPVLLPTKAVESSKQTSAAPTKMEINSKADG